jgi:diaminopimelate decarboxylase
MVGGCGVTELVGDHGSPAYVIDEADFRQRAARFARAFTGWSVNYAGKALLNRTVARWVDQEGLGLDVCSENELAIALAAGFPVERIEFHGNNKSMAELVSAVESGVGRIVVDCFEEIERVDQVARTHDRVVAVQVRVTTGVEAHTHRYIATAGEDQKFGFSIGSGQALAALRDCQSRRHLRLVGVHSHIGSQIFDTEGFVVAARRVFDLVDQFHRASGVWLTEVNLGGGFGIAYTPADTPLAPEELHSRLDRIVRDAREELSLPDTHMAIEPGRAICGPAGVALYTVGVVKPVTLSSGQQRVYVAVDGGMSDNIRPALYQADYTALLANRVSDAPPMLVRVVGKHCESGDVLVRDGYLPSDLAPGDLLAVAGAGAYTRVMASNYNAIARAPLIGVDQGRSRVMIRRETLADILALDAG